MCHSPTKRVLQCIAVDGLIFVSSMERTLCLFKLPLMLVLQFEFSEKKPFWVMKSASKLKTEEKKKQKSLLTSYFI